MWIYNLIFVVVQMVFGVHAVSPVHAARRYVIASSSTTLQSM